MTRITLILSFALASVLGIGLLTVADDDERSAEDALKDLQTQKQTLLEDMLSRYRFGYESGKPVLEELLGAESQLLQAKLEAANTAEKRIELRKSLIENRRKLVEARSAGLNLGNNSEVDIIAARVEVVDAEIALIRETRRVERAR